MTLRTVDTAANTRALVSVSSSRDFLSTSTALSGSLRKALALVAPAVAAGALLISADAIAQVAPNTLPSGSTVQAGSVTITQPDANKLQITQGTDKAIIDWRSYSIGSQGWVNYSMPGQSSVSLNRVTGGDLSYIMGKLTANGTVMLVNPNGIIFGRGSVVDVGGLVATTANIRNDDFMAGRMNFTQAGNPGASVINEGSITIKDAGVAAFVAPGVANRGIIEANLGTVSLAAGNTFTLDLYGDGLVKVAVTDPVTVAALGEGKALVENSGTIKADGGKVLLSAAAAKGVVDQVINMDGAIQARRVSQTADGTIVLDGGDNGTVNVAGKIDVSATGTGVDAGKVTVTGEKVHLRATAHIDATAKTGNGGTVKVGGDYKGQGTTRQAKIVVIDAGALINVSATEAGNGGVAVVWSTDTTSFNGIIMAKGGELAGNGGMVETSGYKLGVGDTAIVDTGALAGSSGTWLLDPANIFIQSTSSAPPANCSSVGTCNAASGDVEVSPLVISGSLLAGNVTLSATNSIVVNGSIAWGATGNDLTLSAPTITVNALISSLGLSGTRDLSFNNVATTVNLNASILLTGSILGTTNVAIVNVGQQNLLTTGSIQQAINIVKVGGTVNVGAGTFFETLTIGKTLTLNGVKSSVDAAADSASRDAVLGSGETTVLPALLTSPTNLVTIADGVANVTISGFRFGGTNLTGVAKVGIGGSFTTGGTGINITNNIFQNFSVAGIKLQNSGSAITGLNISGNWFTAGLIPTSEAAIVLSGDIYGSIKGNRIGDTGLLGFLGFNGTGILVQNYTGSDATKALVIEENTITPLLTNTGIAFKNINSQASFEIDSSTINVGFNGTGVLVADSTFIKLTISDTDILGGQYGVWVKNSHGSLTINGGTFASSVDLSTLLSLTDTPDLSDLAGLITAAGSENISIMLWGVYVEPGMNTVKIDGTSFSTIVYDAVKVQGLAASTFTAINGTYTLVGGNAINFENQNVASTALIDNNTIGLVLGNGIRIANITEGSTLTVTNNLILGVGQHGILLSGLGNSTVGHTVNVNGNDVGGVLAGNAITIENVSGTFSNTVNVKNNIVGLVVAGHGILLSNFSASTNLFTVEGNAALGVLAGDGIRLQGFQNISTGTVNKNVVTLTAGSGIVLDGFSGTNDVTAALNLVTLVGGDGIRFANFSGTSNVTAMLNGVIGVEGTGILFNNFDGTSTATAKLNAVIAAGSDGIRFNDFDGTNVATAKLNLVIDAGNDGIGFSNFHGSNTATALLNGVFNVAGDGISFDQFCGYNVATASLNLVKGAGDDGIQFSRFTGYNKATAALNAVLDSGDDGISFVGFAGRNKATALANLVTNSGGDGIEFAWFAGKTDALASLNIVKGAANDGIAFRGFFSGDYGYNHATAAGNLVNDVGGDGIEFSWFKGKNVATATLNIVSDTGNDGIAFRGFHGFNLATAALNVVSDTGHNGITFAWFGGVNVATATLNLVSDTGHDGIAFNNFFGASLATAALNKVTNAGDDGIQFKNFFGASAATATLNKVDGADDTGIVFKNFFGLNAITATFNVVSGADTGIGVYNVAGASLITVSLNKIDLDWFGTGIDIDNVHGFTTAFVTWNKIEGDKGSIGIRVDDVHGLSFFDIAHNDIHLASSAWGYGWFESIGIKITDVEDFAHFSVSKNKIDIDGSGGTGIYIKNIDDWSTFKIAWNTIYVDDRGTGIGIYKVDDRTSFSVIGNRIDLDKYGVGIDIDNVWDKADFFIAWNKIEGDKGSIGIKINDVRDWAEFDIYKNRIELESSVYGYGKESIGIKISDVDDHAFFSIKKNTIDIDGSGGYGIYVKDVESSWWYKPTGFKIVDNKIWVDDHGTGIKVYDVNDKSWFFIAGNRIDLDKYGTGIDIGKVDDKTDFFIGWNKIEGDRGSVGIKIHDVSDWAEFKIYDNRINLWSSVYGYGKESIGIKIYDVDDHAFFSIKKNTIDIDGSGGYGIYVKDVDSAWYKPTSFDIEKNKIFVDDKGTGIKLQEIDGKSTFFLGYNKIFGGDHSTGVKIYDVSDKTEFVLQNNLIFTGKFSTGVDISKVFDKVNVALNQNWIHTGSFSTGVDISKVYGKANFVFTGNYIDVGNFSVGVNVDKHKGYGQATLSFASNTIKVGYWSIGLFVNNLWGKGGYDIDFQYFNTIKGPNDKYYGIKFLGEGLNLAGDTFGNTKFVGQAKYYIYLAKGALYEPGEPTLIDVSNVNFNGLILGPTPSAGNIAIIEARAEHFLDNGFSGLLFPLNYVQPSVQPIVIPNFNLPQWDPNRVFEVKWFEPFKTSFKWLSGGPYNFGTFELDFPLGTFDPNNVSSLGDIAPAAGPGSDEAKQAESCSQNFMGKFWVWYQQCGPGAQ